MTPNANDVGPGMIAFVFFTILAIVLWFLMKNMTARMRRMDYRHRADENAAAEAERRGSTHEGVEGQ